MVSSSCCLVLLIGLKLFLDLLPPCRLELREFIEGLAEVRADGLKHVGVEVQVLVFSEITAAEGGFQSVAVDNIHLFPSHYTCSSFLTFLDSEGAVSVVKDRGVLLQHEREHLLFAKGVILVRVTVAE